MNRGIRLASVLVVITVVMVPAEVSASSITHSNICSLIPPPIAKSVLAGVGTYGDGSSLDIDTCIYQPATKNAGGGLSFARYNPGYMKANHQTEKQVAQGEAVSDAGPGSLTDPALVTFPSGVGSYAVLFYPSTAPQRSISWVQGPRVYELLVYSKNTSKTAMVRAAKEISQKGRLN